MVLGKLLPPHAGHLYLIGFARRQVERLAVVVEQVAGETIPSALRVRWLRELVPEADIVHLDQPMPQDPADHPHFWSLWREALRERLPFVPAVVFASEAYGHRLAAELGARFLPADPDRELFAVSGTRVRAAPSAWGHYLPAPVRDYYGLPAAPPPTRGEPRRIALIGPESTGKTTLARRLAAAFDARWVPEYAQTLIASGNLRGPALSQADLEDFARGQWASEAELAALGGRVLFCDSDALTTQLYAEALFGHCPAWIAAAARTRHYALTLVSAPDVPWVDAAHRVDPAGRQAFFARCRAALAVLGRPAVILRGDWDQRFGQACQAVERVL